MIQYLNLTVHSNKYTNIDAKFNEHGYYIDRFSNKIYRTDSKENIERLQKLNKQDDVGLGVVTKGKQKRNFLKYISHLLTK